MDKENNKSSDSSLLSTILLDKDTLLVVEKNNSSDYPIVAVRYLSACKTYENQITALTEDTIVEYNDLMVAVFERTSKVFKKPKLVALYDVERHAFGSQELLKLDYGALSHDGYKVKQLNRGSK